jgi:hypothetical protein
MGSSSPRTDLARFGAILSLSMSLHEENTRVKKIFFLWKAGARGGREVEEEAVGRAWALRLWPFREDDDDSNDDDGEGDDDDDDDDS